MLSSRNRGFYALKIHLNQRCSGTETCHRSPYFLIFALQPCCLIPPWQLRGGGLANFGGIVNFNGGSLFNDNVASGSGDGGLGGGLYNTDGGIVT